MPFHEFHLKPEENTLLGAARAFQEACEEHDKAHSECDRTWSWYGDPYMQARDEAWDKLVAAAQGLAPSSPA